MYTLQFSSHFDGAHFLRNYQGKCANIHGHRWVIEAKVSGLKLDDRGLLIDFHDLKTWLKAICDNFDHQQINDIEGFREGELNPTAENIAYYIYQELTSKLNQYPNKVNLDCITVWESPNCGATYSE
jgi:6-pyruvoyltetrahydropterin/6-carboxytetrahydropterin synthase